MADRRREIVDMHRRLATLDHFKLLNVERAAGLDEIKQRYLALARRWHLDSFIGQNLSPDLEAKAKEIFARVKEAYETLTDLDAKQEYLTRLQREAKGLSTDVNAVLRGEQRIDEGLTHIAQRRWAEAEEAFTEARRLNKDDPLIWAHLAYASYRRDPHREDAFVEAKRSLDKAIKAQQNLPEAYFYLGTIYFEREEFKRSIRYLDASLQRGPKNVEAARLIRLARSRQDKLERRSPILALFDRLLGRQ